jgi:hypothetical protein
LLSFLAPDAQNTVRAVVSRRRATMWWGRPSLQSESGRAPCGNRRGEDTFCTPAACKGASGACAPSHASR